MTSIDMQQFIPDKLWYDIESVIDEHMPPKRTWINRHDPRDIFEAILYKLKTNCAWNKIPDYYPDSSAVYRQYCLWENFDILRSMLKMTLDYYVKYGWYDIHKEYPRYRRGIREEDVDADTGNFPYADPW